MIKRVTMTGADGSVWPEQLVELSKKYPLVEWGILISRKRFGTPRFPDVEWLLMLQEAKKEYPEMKLAAHLCGSVVREFMNGDTIFLDQVVNTFMPMFDRVQINTHGEPHEWDAERVGAYIAKSNKVFILQYDNVNTDLLESLCQPSKGLSDKIATLFDLSHGAGISPEKWPDLLTFVKCGYAGGLGPDNIVQQIRLIEEKAGDKEIWIDMETNVRSNNDLNFDLRKVEYCLAAAQAWR